MKNEYSYNILIHSRGPWKNHKYLKKIGNKYIYKISGSARNVDRTGFASGKNGDKDDYTDVSDSGERTIEEWQNVKNNGSKYFERNSDRWFSSSTSYKIGSKSYNYKDIGKLERARKKAQNYLGKKLGLSTSLSVGKKRIK